MVAVQLTDTSKPNRTIQILEEYMEPIREEEEEVVVTEDSKITHPFLPFLIQAPLLEDHLWTPFQHI